MMDPNANLAEQDRILAKPPCASADPLGHGLLSSYDRYRLYDLRVALRDWIAGRGFEPDWQAYPNAARYYQRWRGITDAKWASGAR